MSTDCLRESRQTHLYFDFWEGKRRRDHNPDALFISTILRSVLSTHHVSLSPFSTPPYAAGAIHPVLLQLVRAPGLRANVDVDRRAPSERCPRVCSVHRQFPVLGLVRSQAA